MCLPPAVGAGINEASCEGPGRLRIGMGFWVAVERGKHRAELGWRYPRRNTHPPPKPIWLPRDAAPTVGRQEVQLC